MAHCLITGCRLFVHHGPESVWGDLFGCCDDTILVFAGNMRTYDEKWSEDAKAVRIETDDYVQRHGIFTFSAADAKFSKAASKWIKNSMSWKRW